MKKQFPPSRIILLCLTMLILHISQAQMLTPTVIASTGGFSSNANGSFSYTVGEMTMVQTFSNANNILTQGFQQPDGNVTGLIDVPQNDLGSVILYPNPAVDYSWLGFQFLKPGKITVELFNETGQKLADVLSTNYESGKATSLLNTSMLAAGSYFISLHFINSADGSKQDISKKFLVIK